MRLVPVLLLAALAATASLDGAADAVPTDREAIAHALNRLAFGPRPGDLARVSETGLARWIEQQLHPAGIPDRRVEQRLAALDTMAFDSTTLAREVFLPARQARRAAQRAATPDAGESMTPATRPIPVGDAIRNERRVFVELGEAKLLRAVYSERQLEEVLVDFWFNHFNVFARKAHTGIYIGEYEREAIRPHVLGRFRTLLGATAKSPAMLVYLDNWQSAAPGTPARGQRAPRGLNENYARELLELHTLGVDGGYTQDDIVNIARAFTGWTVGRPGEAGFRFAPFMHDRHAKTVLGHAIPAGGGIDDGETVLDMLARHPSTARHVAFKLAQRFVSDTPPEALVARAAEAFRRSDGNLREVVRVVVTSPEFFAPEHRLAKVKTPFELVASALRAADAEIRSSPALLRALADMGMPLYLCQPPTGYDETAAAWVSSGALVSRINFAVELSAGRLRGVDVPPTLGGEALALGSADFQKQ